MAIEGFIAAPLTGFKPNGSINLEIIPRYANMLHQNGVSGVFVNGTTGEGKSLTFDERIALAERWVKSAPEGFRVIVHVGYTDQVQSKALAVHAGEIGADAIGEIGPANVDLPTVEKLVEYTAETAASVPGLPYFYYHIPSISNIHFPMVEFLKLADIAIPSLAGIKYTWEDLDDYALCKEFRNGRYDILFGRDEILLESLKLGANGAVGSTYNIMPALYHKLVQAYKEGNLTTAGELQVISANACRVIYDSGNFFAGLKTVLRYIGLDLGKVRPPLTNLSDEAVEKLELYLKKSDITPFLIQLRI